MSAYRERNECAAFRIWPRIFAIAFSAGACPCNTFASALVHEKFRISRCIRSCLRLISSKCARSASSAGVFCSKSNTESSAASFKKALSFSSSAISSKKRASSISARLRASVCRWLSGFIFSALLTRPSVAALLKNSLKAFSASVRLRSAVYPLISAKIFRYAAGFCIIASIARRCCFSVKGWPLLMAVATAGNTPSRFAVSSAGIAPACAASLYCRKNERKASFSLAIFKKVSSFIFSFFISFCSAASSSGPIASRNVLSAFARSSALE